MALNPLNGDLTAGLAGRSSTIVNPAADPLVTGDVPQLLVTDETVLTTQTLAALTVVGFDAGGKLVPAVLGGATPIQAVGILVYAVDTTGGDKTGQVYRMGCFNPDLLVWDASYATDANKKAAFEGAPSPTAIITRKPATLSV